MSINLPPWTSLITVASIYMYAVLIRVPTIYHREYFTHQNLPQCVTMWDKNTSFYYNTTFVFMYDLIPLFIISCAQITMLRNLKRHFEDLELLNTSPFMMRIRLKKQKKLVGTFLAVVPFFFIFTLPNAIFMIIFSYISSYRPSLLQSHSKKLYTTWDAFIALSAFNSCSNPIIYAKVHRQMNRPIAKALSTLSRKFSSRRSKTDSPEMVRMVKVWR